MKLTFQNSSGNERMIANVANEEDVHREIKRFCADHDFRVPYTRTWVDEDDVVTYDVGSHTEFFKLYKA